MCPHVGGEHIPMFMDYNVLLHTGIWDRDRTALQG